MKNGRKLLLALAWLLLLMVPGPAKAATLAEIFILLPSSECGGYNAPQRQDLLAALTEAPGEMGPASVPDPFTPWLRLVADNFLVLQRPRGGPITYKLYEGRSFQLLVICRGRHRPTPGDPVDPLDLGFFRMDRTGLHKVDPSDYLPYIGILDFVTAATVTDPRAVRTLARLAPTYTECLSCSLSDTHRLTLDIVTATSLNAAPCDDLLPNFGHLPLTWNGQVFTKPYDRAAPREEDRDRRPDAANASPGR